ncbi:hypothetical protein ASG31_08495 [Chryseobacterium sp. Leaf404]|uniref:hypothetical protein n=1 Tax=unclassified Chryseobacterium TaxID=2593645 RepID=UPI0006F9A57C|nr:MULTISPECIES: hypothetical protein [unclassified Chryseobacterium]KQT17440.1 hypothetical protein ASG31_08495 [Chryseobacterium sp. Leaf404]
MKILLTPMSCLFLLTSCKYNTEQKALLSKIENSKSEIFEENFENVITETFAKDDLAELSSNQNAKIAIYFYEILLKRYPTEAYHIFLKNINNTEKIVISTSYDTLQEMTVSEAMLYYATLKNNVFSQKQLDVISDKIILDLDNKKHLSGHLTLYLDNNKENPKPKYYSILRAEIQKKIPDNYYNNITLLTYFSNYNKPEDVKLITECLENSIYREPTYFNSAIEFINHSPKPEYFKILENYYDRKINGKKFRADDIFFELELFTKAVSKYKNEEGKKLLDKLIKKTSYFSEGSFLAPNEQIFLILESEDKTNFFSDEKTILSKQINKTVIDTIKNYNKRWN